MGGGGRYARVSFGKNRSSLVHRRENEKKHDGGRGVVTIGSVQIDSSVELSRGKLRGRS